MPTVLTLTPAGSTTLTLSPGQSNYIYPSSMTFPGPGTFPGTRDLTMSVAGTSTLTLTPA